MTNLPEEPTNEKPLFDRLQSFMDTKWPTVGDIPNDNPPCTVRASTVRASSEAAKLIYDWFVAECDKRGWVVDYDADYDRFKIRKKV